MTSDYQNSMKKVVSVNFDKGATCMMKGKIKFSLTMRWYFVDMILKIHMVYHNIICGIDAKILMPVKCLVSFLNLVYNHQNKKWGKLIQGYI